MNAERRLRDRRWSTGYPWGTYPRADAVVVAVLVVTAGISTGLIVLMVVLP